MTDAEKLAYQLSHLYPNADKDLSFVVLTQERLDEMVQTAYYQGFGAGLAHAVFGHLIDDEVSDEPSGPGNRAIRAAAESSSRPAG